MQDIFGSVRRSLVFRAPLDSEEDSHSPPVGGNLVERINSCIRKSRVFSKPSSPSLPPVPKEMAPPIRWRRGELIGSGAYGRVYMGMNLDTGELLAVKQVLIAGNSSSKERAQTQIKELEDEVKLLKDLSHPNIVRYLGTIREDDSLNIVMEFVPGGSIASLLDKFQAFSEAVMKKYTRQLLYGLEYLHQNNIIHRDIKGANILVDNKGCIKLADFGASKQVVELATISGAKSVKGTPYWMAPEVIIGTGHSFSADIWSVGCTVIEMATGKAPWSGQYQEVTAVIFHIGKTKSHPPIPEHLSFEAKDFLLKCLQEKPDSRPTASELLKHPFIRGDVVSHSEVHAESSNSTQLDTSFSNVYTEKPGCNNQWLTNNSEDDMCQIGDMDSVMLDMKPFSSVTPENLKSYNPVCEPSHDWGGKIDRSSGLEGGSNLDADQQFYGSQSGGFAEEDKDLSTPCGPSLSEDDEELTESKIRAFLDAEALKLKKLQTPLYEEFYNSLNPSCSPGFIESNQDEIAAKYLKLPPKSKSSPSRGPGIPSTVVDGIGNGSPMSNSTGISNGGNTNDQCSPENASTQVNERKGLLKDGQPETSSPSAFVSEMQRKWKEELDQELERKREELRQAGIGAKTSSPKDRALNRQRDRTRFGSPGK